MGADVKTEHLEPFSPCTIKKQLFLLLQKIDEARNVENNSTVNGRKLKQKTIVEATQLSEIILEIHDKTKVCKCFPNTKNLNDFEILTRRKQLDLMIDYLKKLNGFIKLLDTVDVAKKQVSNKPLNPLSKIFVPKYLCITKHLDLSDGLEKNESTSNISIRNKVPGNSAINTEGKVATNFNLPKEVLNRPKSNSVNSYNADLKYFVPTELGVQLGNNLTLEYSAKPEAFNESYSNVLKSTSIKQLWLTSNKENNCQKVNTVETSAAVDNFRRKYNSFNNNWSINAEDQKLLNKKLDKPCGCPPCFGYNVPPDFLGNPLKLKPLCNQSQIHMSCYVNDCRKEQEIPPNGEIPNHLPEEFDNTTQNKTAEKFLEFRLKKHKKDFQKFVKDVVCNITEVLEETESNASTRNSKITEDRFKGRKMDIREINKRLPDIPPGNTAYLNSIDKHDMLNGFSRCARLSQQHHDYLRLNSLLCNKPCSVWCDVNDKTWGWNKRLQNSKKKLTESDLKEKGFEDFDQSVHSAKETSTSSIYNGRKLPKPRNSLGESGYESSTTYSSVDSIERNTGEIDTESKYWTPLPDCIPQPCDEGLDNHRPSKVVKSRIKNTRALNESVKQKSRSNLEGNKRKAIEIRSRTSEEPKVLSDSDFPVLK